MRSLLILKLVKYKIDIIFIMLSRRAIARWFSNGKPPKMAPFDPKAHGLDEKFVLTNYTKMKG